MKKITLLLLAMVAFCWQSNAQFTESFETEIPAAWTVLDLASSGTWAQSTTITGGAQDGSGAAKIIYDTSAAHDDYLITPAITVTAGMNDRLSFWVKSRSSAYLEPYEVLLSSVSTDAADFTTVLQPSTDAPATWTELTFDLSAYVGSTIYVAVRATGNNEWELYADNFVNDTAPQCTQPTATAIVGTTDCAGAGTFMIDVDVTNLGDATSLTISNDAGVASTPTAATGIVSVGPFNSGTDVTITVEHDQDSICNLQLDSISYYCPPVNDECLDAITLTVNTDLACGSVTAGTNVAATESSEMETSGEITGTPYTDVWYNFVATSEYHTISLTNVVAVIGTSTDMGMALYDATSGCGASLAAPIKDSDPNSFTVTGLTIGTTYLLRVYGWSNTQSTSAQTTFDVCVGIPPEPVANDDCDGATVVTPSMDNTCTTVVSGTTENAYDSNDGCGTSGKDVWYSFTAAVDGTYTVTIDETFDSGFTSTYVSAYEGSCGALTQVGSSTSCSNTSDLIVTTVSGQTYYVNVRSSSATNYTEFDLCIYVNPPAPENDDCDGATVVTPSMDNTCTTAVSGTTQSATDSTDGCGTSGRDVWYSFTAAVDGTYTVTIDETFDSGFTSTYVSAYEGSCGALTQIGSSTSCFNTSNLIVTTVSGQTYYVNVRSSSATNYTEFDLCIYVNPPAPANDDCENATPISASTDSSCNNVISGTTQSATDSTDGCGTSGRDVWYSFTAPADGDFVITETETFDSGSTTTYVTAYEGACGALTQVGSSTSCTNSNALTLTAVSGTTYYVNIRSSSATNYTEFDLCIFQLVVPENDACENATTINAGDSISGSTVGATNVENLTVCSGGTVGTTCDPGGDSSPNGGTLVFGTGVWYVYNSPGNESISIEDSAGAFDSEIQVWSGACGSLVCVAGDDDSSNVGSGGFVCFDSEATPTTYYIYIDGNASTGVGNYTLNLNTTPLPPANNLCSGAEALTLGVQATGDTTNATDSGVAAASCGAAGADQDIWYSFVATATGQVDIDTDADTAAVYDACGGTEIACVGTGVTNVDGLVDGTTYYVRLYNTGTAKVAGPVVLTVTESSLSTTDFDNNIVFSYYPNPVKNTLTLSAQEEISNVTIVNMLGQTVLKAAPNAVSKELDMSSLSSGAYFVQVTVGNAVDTVKIIKN